MGSYVHAKWLKDEKIMVLGMISLEMIGYFKDEKNSQDYPVRELSWIYGNKGYNTPFCKKSNFDLENMKLENLRIEYLDEENLNYMRQFLSEDELELVNPSDFDEIELDGVTLLPTRLAWK